MIAAGVRVCGSCLLILLLLLLMMLLPLLLLLLIMMMLLLMLLMLMMLQMVLLLLLQCALLPAPLLQLIMICNQLSIPSPAGPTLPRPSRLLPPSCPSSANFSSLSNYNHWQQCLPQDMPEMQATAAAAGAAAAPDAARLLTLADDMRHLCDNVFTCDGAQSACMLR